MAEWTAENKREGKVLVDGFNYLNLQSLGHFSWEESSSSSGWESTTDYDDDEHLIAIQSSGYLSPTVSGTDSPWSDVSKASAEWTETVKSGTVAAQFELNEPLGGPEWVDVTRDT
jgi:hypothetical protein